MSLDEIQWGDLWIARETDTVVQFDHDPSRVSEVVPLVAAANASVRDRGNASHRLVIGVLREHEGISAARAFILAHAKAIDLLLQETPRNLLVRYKASPVTEYTLTPAVLTAYPSRQQGVSTTHTYTFVGARIS